MLVLSRRSRQSVFIGNQVKVTVLHISPKHVELGIEAPPEVAVDREEVHLRKQGEAGTPASTRSHRILETR